MIKNHVMIVQALWDKKQTGKLLTVLPRKLIIWNF